MIIIAAMRAVVKPIPHSYPKPVSEMATIEFDVIAGAVIGVVLEGDILIHGTQDAPIYGIVGEVFGDECLVYVAGVFWRSDLRIYDFGNEKWVPVDEATIEHWVEYQQIERASIGGKEAVALYQILED